MNFGISGDGAGSSTSWLFGRSKNNLTPPSPATASPAGPSGIAATLNDVPPAQDDLSFAESFRPETSPLFNPTLMPRSDAPDAATSLGLSPDTPRTWNWQSTVGNPNDNQSPPFVGNVREPSPDLSTHFSAAAALEANGDQELGTATPSREASPLQESAAHSVDSQAASAIEVGDADTQASDSHEQQLAAKDFEISLENANEVDGVLDDQTGPVEMKSTEDAPSPTRAASEHLSEDGHPSAEAPPSARRSRRSGAEMLSAAAESFVKDVSGPRKRQSAYPASPAVKATPTAARRSRKSLPARIDATTPRKRGRPRKSEIAATPATKTPGTAKRGRPRKSDVLASVGKTAQSSSAAATPNKRGNLRVSLALGTPFTATEDTPKRRGRPPKISQSAVETPAKSGRGRKPAKTRAAPSPMKRGRPAGKTTASAPKPAARRGRPAGKSTGAKVTAAAASAGAPKRRGRPPKNDTASKADERAKKPQAKQPATKKRGRGAAVSEDTAPTVGAKRGRPTRSEPEPEPAAKRQRITRRAEEPAATKAEAKSDTAAVAKPTRSGRNAAPAKKDAPKAKQPKTQPAAEPAAPTRKSGRGTEKETSEPKVDAVDAPKTRTRGRGAAQTAAEKTVEKPASKTRARAAKSGKGELPSSKPAAETEAPKRAKARGATAPTRVEKPSATAVGTRRSTRSAE